MAVCALLLMVGVLAAYADVIAGLIRQWWTDDNYSHGFLVVPLALYFAWQKRTALAVLPARPDPWAGAGVLLAAALFVVGTAAAELFLARLSLVLLIAASIGVVWSRDHVRVLRFPLFFLLLMIPPPGIVFNQVAFPLQMLASQVGEVTLRSAGVPVLREGNVLELETMRLEVAEACSGIRSIVSLFAFGLIVGRFGGASPAGLGILALATVPIAVLANAARVAGTGLAAHVWGSAATEGVAHGLAGALVFMGAAAGLLAVHRLAGRVRVVAS